jgi:hypothetical protein
VRFLAVLLVFFGLCAGAYFLLDVGSWRERGADWGGEAQPEPPPEGRFRLGPAPWQEPGRGRSRPGTCSFAFRVDYRGPRPWLEIVARNREGSGTAEESVLVRRRTSSSALLVIADLEAGREAPAGGTMVTLSAAITDAVDLTAWTAPEREFRCAALVDGAAGLRSEPGDDAAYRTASEHHDAEEIVLWRRARGDAVTTLILRFAAR